MADHYGSYPSTPGSTLPALRPPRTWPALLTLFVLSPMVAEMLTGSTPPLSFISPFSLLFELPLYGSGAILVRELARRRQSGWTNILLLGMAYGVLEEGLVVTSWFNPYWPDLGKLATYGRLFDTSWVWATELTIFHAVVSITIPILLTEILFPNIAKRPWLGERGFRGFVVLLTITSLVEMILFGFLYSRKLGYMHPPLMYLGALLLAIGFVWLGLHVRPQARTTARVETRAAPGLWSLRLLGFAITLAFFIAAWIIPSLIPLPIVPIALLIGMVLYSIRALKNWASRAGWSAQHQLALATGAIAFFVALSPLVEFALHSAGKAETGLVVVDVVCLGALALLAWSVSRRDRSTVKAAA